MSDPGIRAVKLFDFDATALSRDPRTVFTRLHIYRATVIDFVSEGGQHWTEFARTFEMSGPTFAWPSVFSFQPEATTLAIGFGNVIEAMIQFQPQKTVLCPNGQRGPTTYVTFLEVAPWNRADHEARRFGGLGTLLLQYASARTFAAGQGGALGLHSLPEAAGFYKTVGFASYDCPNEHHELYLELNEDRAHEFRSLGGF